MWRMKWSRDQVMAGSADAGLELVVRRKLVGALQVGGRAVNLGAGVDRGVKQRLLDYAVAGFEGNHAGEEPVAVVVGRLEVPPLCGAVAVDGGFDGVGGQRLVVIAPNDRLARHKGGAGGRRAGRRVPGRVRGA